MTKYVDLHVIPNATDETACHKMAENLKLAGYSAVAIAVPPGLMRDKVDRIRRVFQNNGLEAVMRIDLGSGHRPELLKLLRRYRGDFDIIAVRCANQIIGSVACRDRRVDVVYFEAGNQKTRFTHSLANLLHGAVEFNLVSSLANGSSYMLLTRLAKEISVAREHGVHIVFSSGSSSPDLVRSPFQIAAIASALGAPSAESLRSLSETPASIIEKNLARRSNQYIEEGVKVVLARAK